MKNGRNLEKGYRCPHCSQLVKVYKRSFNCNMALCLLLLLKHKVFDFVKVEDFLIRQGHKRCGDFSYLRHYGFLEKKIADREDGSNRNGFYKLTDKGIAFAKGETKAHARFFIYNNQLEGFAGEEINIRQALGKKFDYQELMGM